MIKIRPYQYPDEEAILDLDCRVLPSEWNPRTLSNWKWKFTAANPAGRASIWLAEFEGRIIAHFAAVPVKVKVFQESVMGSHTIGALVEESYQNRGLLKLLADKLWDDLSSKRVALTWGLPNERAYSFHKLFLGYGDLMELATWRNTRPFPPRRSLSRCLEHLPHFDGAADRLWERASRDYPVCVIRDRAYLNWRYLQRPDWTYYPFGIFEEGELAGYVVLKIFQEAAVLRGHIIDLFASAGDDETIAELIDGSLIFFEERGVDEVTAWLEGPVRLCGVLETAGFRRTGQVRPLVLRLNSGELSRNRVFERSNWYFTMGDSTEIF